MYEFLVLGRLANAPMHGYMIAKVIDKIMGPFRQVQWGALYPVLNRLERDGLIRAEEAELETDGRTRKVYAITEAGRERLHTLLMETERHQGEYDMIFCLKVGLFSHLTSEERMYLARHYAVYAQQNLAHMERTHCSLAEGSEHGLVPAHAANIRDVIDHRIKYWRQERAWAEELIAREHHLKEAM
jgi:DNA-binding PadR family transcriptional regulator